jgi:hypothetical protein
MAHVKLANGRTTLATMGHAVDDQTARPADAFAAIRIERDRIFSTRD